MTAIHTARPRRHSNGSVTAASGRSGSQRTWARRSALGAQNLDIETDCLTRTPQHPRSDIGSPARRARIPRRARQYATRQQGRLVLRLVSFLVLVVVSTMGLIGNARGFDAATSPAASKSSAKSPAQRKSRANSAQSQAQATKPATFSGYPEAPPFAVTPRKDNLTVYPCSTCHGLWKPDPTPRQLNAPHAAAMKHGNGRMWCVDCHALKNRDVLEAVGGTKIHFDDSHLLCGQCHANRHRDWYFGAHGKRADNWSGERTLYNCAHCHDPHDPSIKPREPWPVPSVRAGLKPMSRTPHEVVPVWERASRQSTEAKP